MLIFTTRVGRFSRICRWASLFVGSGMVLNILAVERQYCLFWRGGWGFVKILEIERYFLALVYFVSLVEWWWWWYGVGCFL